jgi:PAS domain-containing protein
MMQGAGLAKRKTNVTEIKETQQLLNSVLEETSVLKQVLNNIEQVVWVKDLSNDRIIYVSPAFKSLWGRSPEDL